MIDLIIRKNSDDHLLRLIKENDINEWNIYLCNWLGKNRESMMDGIDMKTTKPITMNEKDLKQLINEIKKALKEKPKNQKELNLTFQENKPQFKILIQYMHPGTIWYDKDKKNTFRLSVGFNIKYSYVKHEAAGDEYLYEGGGRHQFLNIHYTKEELQKFADDLEKEANEKNKKQAQGNFLQNIF